MEFNSYSIFLGLIAVIWLISHFAHMSAIKRRYRKRSEDFQRQMDAALRESATRGDRKMVEKWCIFNAARYDNGKLIDAIDDSLKSGGHRVMVPIEDYEHLLAEVRVAARR